MKQDERSESVSVERTKPFLIFLRLIKYKISATVAFTTLPGYVLIHHKIDASFWAILAGVYLLASAATALNQIQEREYDALMLRTNQRPLPLKQISVAGAYVIFFILFISGLTLLCRWGGYIPCILGIFNILWYNGFYTYLKRKTSFAVVPGSIVGAIPPMIGWTAAGGSIISSQVWALGFFLFIWQIPHFWILMVRYNDDYRRAGYPVISDIFSSLQIRNITATWIIASAASIGLFPFFRLIHSFWVLIFAAFIALSIIGWIIISVFRKEEIHKQKFSFALINACMVIAMILITFDNI